MQKIAVARGGLLLTAAVAVGLLAALYAARAGGASSSARARVVTTAKNKMLGKTVLVTRQGLTLYSLSVERKGKFICTDDICLSLWTPLLVPKGTTPTGVSGLATIKRPGAQGRLQVTYRGGPLYTFYLDKHAGEANGEGFKDVGIWHAAPAAG